jgi:hypothetical protein
MRKADRAGELKREGITKAPQTIRISIPRAFRTLDHPEEQIFRGQDVAANPEKGIYEPASDWVRLDRY